MLNWKEVSDGNCSQKTCKVGDSEDYTFVVGEVQLTQVQYNNTLVMMYVVT